MKILDVGCGLRKTEGAIGIDKHKLKGVDVVHDLEKFPWPFRQNYFDKIICNHISEYLTDVIKTMEEIHRIAKPNAITEIEVPFYRHELAYMDPTHKRFFTPNTFGYFTDKHENRYYSKARFFVIKRQMIREHHRILPDFLFPFERIRFKLKTLKQGEIK